MPLQNPEASVLFNPYSKELKMEVTLPQGAWDTTNINTLPSIFANNKLLIKHYSSANNLIKTLDNYNVIHKIEGKVTYHYAHNLPSLNYEHEMILSEFSQNENLKGKVESLSFSMRKNYDYKSMNELLNFIKDNNYIKSLHIRGLVNDKIIRALTHRIEDGELTEILKNHSTIKEFSIDYSWLQNCSPVTERVSSIIYDSCIRLAKILEINQTITNFSIRGLTLTDDQYINLLQTMKSSIDFDKNQSVTSITIERVDSQDTQLSLQLIQEIKDILSKNTEIYKLKERILELEQQLQDKDQNIKAMNSYRPGLF